VGAFFENPVRIEQDVGFLQGFEPLFGGEFKAAGGGGGGWMFGVKVHLGAPTVAELQILGIFAVSESAPVSGGGDFLVLLVGPITQF